MDIRVHNVTVSKMRESAHIRSFSVPYSPTFELLRISPYSVRMRENTDQKNTEYGHCTCSGYATSRSSIDQLA